MFKLLIFRGSKGANYRMAKKTKWHDNIIKLKSKEPSAKPPKQPPNPP